MHNKTVVIIGGGIGGLFAGAFLAKEGFCVTIIEKNTTIGGGLQSFVRFGETFDTGMHVIGGMQPGGNIYKICKYLNILDRINLSEVDDDCTDEVYIACDKTTYKIAKGKDGFINSLAAYFPHQRNELAQYVDAMIALTQELDLFYLRKPSNSIFSHSDDFYLSADKFIAKYISDPQLRAVLSFQNLLYAGEGDVTPAFIHAIIPVLYMKCPMRFVGGTSQFADALAHVIKSNGGTVIAGDAAVQVHCENKSIVKCVTASGKELVGDYFISAIHPSAFVQLLQDKSAFPKAYRNRIDNINNSYSALILNIKLKPQSVEYFNYTGHYFNNADDVWKSPTDAAIWPNICLYMTPPAENQSKYASTMNIIVPMSWEEVLPWEDTTTRRRGDDYIGWKKEKAAAVIKAMEDVFPNLADCIENIDISTPLTIRDYYGVKHGALYGYKKDCNNLVQSRVPVRTKISNLFMTGQNHNIHGFCGVALTAIETCENIIGSNQILDNINND